MKRSKRHGSFQIRALRVTVADFSYATYRVEGWLDGKRVRRQFKIEAEARAEKLRLEVQAANEASMRSAVTRLTEQQLAEAESAVRRLGAVTIATAVDWYLENWRPPVTAQKLSDAVEAFLAERRLYVSPRVAGEYKRELRRLCVVFPEEQVHDLDEAKVLAYLGRYQLGKKGWNNLRGYLHAFFGWAARRPRCWTLDNPLQSVPMHKISRGLPEILTTAKVAELFAFLEGYAGGPRSKRRPGCLVPYFALATFAGLRPAVPGGEIWRLGGMKTLERVIDLETGVIRILPGAAKTNDLRQVTIQPNLRAWLERYPLKEFPLVPVNLQTMVTAVRKRFELSHDVLRHTYISMHVAKFRSLGDTALQAGNSERIIRKHYLNLVPPGDAEAFWQIVPKVGK